MADGGSVARRVVVRGRVQDGFFRRETLERARAVGAAGWVRNRDDGAVEALVEGQAEAVEEVLAFLRRGPAHAQVADVEVAVVEPSGLSGFVVR